MYHIAEAIRESIVWAKMAGAMTTTISPSDVTIAPLRPVMRIGRRIGMLKAGSTPVGTSSPLAPCPLHVRFGQIGIPSVVQFPTEDVRDGRKPALLPTANGEGQLCLAPALS